MALHNLYTGRRHRLWFAKYMAESQARWVLSQKLMNEMSDYVQQTAAENAMLKQRLRKYEGAEHDEQQCSS